MTVLAHSTCVSLIHVYRGWVCRGPLGREGDVLCLLSSRNQTGQAKTKEEAQVALAPLTKIYTELLVPISDDELIETETGIGSCLGGACVLWRVSTVTGPSPGPATTVQNPLTLNELTSPPAAAQYRDNVVLVGGGGEMGPVGRDVGLRCTSEGCTGESDAVFVWGPRWKVSAAPQCLLRVLIALFPLASGILS